MQRLLVLFSLLPLWLSGQETTDSIWKIDLDEVIISYSAPLQTGDLVNFYKAGSFSSIDEVNSRLPGVSLIKRGAYAMEPQMHGFSAGQLNINIDGMKIFGACTDKMDPVTSYVETDNLESIALNHGTDGCESGSTIGGSMNLMLVEARRDSSNSFHLELGSGYETAARGKNLKMVGSIGRRRLAIRTVAVYRKYEPYTDGNGDVVPFTQFEKLNLNGNATYQFKHGSTLKADLIYDRAVNVGYPALPMDVGLARATIAGVEFRKAETKQGIKNLKAKVYYNTIYHLMDDSKRDSLYLLANHSSGKTDSVYMRMDMPGWSDTGGTWISGEYRVKKHRLLFKAEDYFNLASAEMTMYMNNLSRPGEPPMYAETWPETFRNVAGIYLNDDIELARNIQLKLNFRFDFSYTKMLSEYGVQELSVFGYQADQPYWQPLVSSNMGIYYQPVKGVKMDVALGYGERLPTLGEQFGYYLYNAHDGYDYVGNPELRTEKAIQIKQSVSYSGKKLKVSWNNQLSRVNDFIFGETETEIPPMNLYASGLKMYQNLPSVLLFSSDFQLKMNLTKAFGLFSVLSYTYGANHMKEALPLIPPLNNLLALNYNWHGFTIQFENYTSLAQNRIDEAFGEKATPAFSIFNFRLNQVIPIGKGQLDWSLSVSNLMNTVYSEHLDWGNYYRQGRNLSMNLNYRF
ncbi:MAG: TonB-dependent receptor plug domain-containing protein [Prolixibacteraceae bacterium]